MFLICVRVKNSLGLTREGVRGYCYSSQSMFTQAWSGLTHTSVGLHGLWLELGWEIAQVELRRGERCYSTSYSRSARSVQRLSSSRKCTHDSLGRRLGAGMVLVSHTVVGAVCWCLNETRRCGRARIADPSSTEL